MPVLNDVKTATKVLRTMLTSRSNRRELERRVPSVTRLKPRSIHIAVYFADSEVNLYQVRQWYRPLAEMAKRWPVAFITRSPSSALPMLEESPVPVVYLRKIAELEEFVAAQDIRIVLYVNQNSKNFQMFRYGRMWHVFINHGESDKMYMTTNQFKAYDYSLVAGEAARDRLRLKLWDFDIERRAIMIGRPQSDHLDGVVPFAPDDRCVVLYSPTWEGDRAAASYGSVATHGVALTRAILASPRHRLVYRPHPRSGVIDPVFKRANESIIAAIAAANASDPTARHIFDESPELDWQLSAADVAICDISAMVYDRLATGRPVLVTQPVSELAEIDSGGYLGDAEWLTAAESADVISVIDRALTNDESKEKLDFWVRRHFGDITPGEATRRFHAAIEGLMAEWDAQAAMHTEVIPDEVGDDDETAEDD